MSEGISEELAEDSEDSQLYPEADKNPELTFTLG